MTSYVVPKKGVEFIFYFSLVDQSNTKLMKSNPTIAAGDFKVSIDGGALANPATLPAVTPAAGKMVKGVLSTSEMNGDNVTFVASDASGAEWCDLVINIQTAARQIDDLTWPTVSGRSTDVSAGGEVGIDWANIGSPTTTVALSGTTVKTATDVETDTQDIQSRLPAALVSGRIDASAGALAANVITTTSINNGALTAAKFAAGAFDAVWSVTSRTLSAFGFNVTVDTNNDKTGYGLSAAAVQAIWDALTSALTTVGSIGKLLADNINDTITSRMATFTYTTPPTVVQVRTEMDSNSTQLAAIVDDTGNAGVVVAAASKSGYALSSTGLDSVATTAPSGVASNFREMVVQVWRRHFKKSTLTSTELKTYADNGSTVLTTQVVSDDNTTQTMGSAT